MPDLFKPEYKDKKSGRTKATKYWYVRIAGKRYPLRVTDKRIAEKKAAELLRRIESGEDPDRVRNAGREDLDAHISALGLSLKADGCCSRWVSQSVSRLRRVFEECGIARLDDLRLPLIEAWLVRQQAGKRFNGQTTKHYCRTLFQLGKFLETRELVHRNPFASLGKKINVEVGRKIRRRALTVGEFRALLSSVAASPTTRCRMTGPHRRVLYWVAGTTGLRRGELGTLTRESFSLLSDPPTVTVTACRTKNRKTAVLPLRGDLASELGPWLAGHPAAAVLFPVGGCSTSLMIRADLLDAKIDFEVQGRRVDFHALRMTMISHLQTNNVPLVTAQKLARHSTPVLTANVYTQLGLDELKKAVESVPDVGTGSRPTGGNGAEG